MNEKTINIQKTNKTWDEVYDKKNYHYGESPNRFLEDNFSKIKSGGKVLCLGSGEGRNAVFLAKKGYLVTAVDYSKVGIRKTELLAEKNGVKLKTVLDDLKNYIPEKEKYDAVISIFLHLPPEIRTPLSKKIISALRPEGIFIAEYYHLDQLKNNTGGPKNKEMLLSCEIISEIFQGLDFEILEKKNKTVIEGEGHTGKCTVVDVIARKR